MKKAGNLSFQCQVMILDYVVFDSSRYTYCRYCCVILDPFPLLWCNSPYTVFSGKAKLLNSVLQLSGIIWFLTNSYKWHFICVTPQIKTLSLWK